MSEPRFQILLAFCWQTNFLESFLIWVCFLTPLAVWYCVLKFSFSFFLRGKAYKHIQRTNYKIPGIKIERQENYQLKNAVSIKNEHLMVEFYPACSACRILKAIPQAKHALF